MENMLNRQQIYSVFNTPSVLEEDSVSSVTLWGEKQTEERVVNSEWTDEKCAGTASQATLQRNSTLTSPLLAASCVRYDQMWVCEAQDAISAY